ncbi:MAG TPA: hypothetical protein VNM47_07810, partial [Terriglobia bacterium]|nr:hypothetical protein [Terriglobia bacterium]
MQTSIPTLETVSWRRCLMAAAVAFALLSMPAVSQTALAQSDPLNFGNNYFVTGDYVVAGVGLRGLGGSTGYATGTINMPDLYSEPATGVPAGAQVIAAFLYWQTVESSQTTFAGQQGFFRPVYTGGPSTGYAITGTVLGNPNAPVAWSSGGCSGNSQGSKTIRTYRADVRPFLRVDSEGNVLAGNSSLPAQYEVRLADSGSNGGGAPLTLGATLVFIYRVLDLNVPLNSIVIYDGSFAPSNSSSDMTQTIEGFYQAAASPIAKLTHIVGNGQANKYENVYLDGVYLPSLYGVSSPPFPGNYNGSWDNPTWIVNNYGSAVQPGDSDATTMVAPSASNSGCVSWGAVILSTTVKDSDNDGLLDVWEQNHGYCDASLDTACAHNDSDPAWVSLPGADPDKKDIFVQMDYMCRDPNATTCDPTDVASFLPSQTALNKVESAFGGNHGIDLHLITGNAIQQTECTDDPTASPPVVCPVPSQPGVVGWKGGFVFLKNQPLNYPDENSCEQALDGPCMRRFQHGRKDSYHYALFGYALGAPSWSMGV